MGPQASLTTTGDLHADGKVWQYQIGTPDPRDTVTVIASHSIIYHLGGKTGGCTESKKNDMG